MIHFSKAAVHTQNAIGNLEQSSSPSHGSPCPASRQATVAWVIYSQHTVMKTLRFSGSPADCLTSPTCPWTTFPPCSRSRAKPESTFAQVQSCCSLLHSHPSHHRLVAGRQDSSRSDRVTCCSTTCLVLVEWVTNVAVVTRVSPQSKNGLLERWGFIVLCHGPSVLGFSTPDSSKYVSVGRMLSTIDCIDWHQNTCNPALDISSVASAPWAPVKCFR